MDACFECFCWQVGDVLDGLTIVMPRSTKVVQFVADHLCLQ